MDIDQRQLAEWCSRYGHRSVALTPLLGDAGFRRYFRLGDDGSQLAVIAPPDKVDIEQWQSLGEFLAKQRVRVPAVYQCDPHKGFLLLEDLGSELMLDGLSGAASEQRYEQALSTLAILQRIDRHSMTVPEIPEYDADCFRLEMQLFPEWFIDRLLGLKLAESEHRLLLSVFRLLEREAGALPTVFVHCDYHSRNLLIIDSQNLGVIDFQDAKWGTPVYDLVSLLKDCYIYWPREQVLKWFDRWASDLRGAGIIPSECSRQMLLRHFDLVGLQRHLKVLGIFARLWLRDHKWRYLQHLPLVCRYVGECCELYPELTEFGTFFQQRLQPACSSQTWWVS